jgi:hypothetical protein
MANYLIGLDFGTSQTKVCLLNKDDGIREFIKFVNNEYFLPSLIVKKEDGCFTYGNESIHGRKYRYFKMAAAEDEELIQTTNENLNGILENGTIDDYKKYSSDHGVKPEFLVVLYLSYIYLYVLEFKKDKLREKPRGLLARLAGNRNTSESNFSINLGIPTEWDNPDHIKRKIKFQSLLLTSIKLAKQFQNLEKYLSANEEDLMARIVRINDEQLNELLNKETKQKAEIVGSWLKSFELSVFPESAAGINYLLKTKRLGNGSYATLDIGAGTSDIALFEVQSNKLIRYYCSESTSIASNDFYREYAKEYLKLNEITYDDIQKVEIIIKNNIGIDQVSIAKAKSAIKGFLNSKGIEFAIRKMFYRKYYKSLHEINQVKAYDSKNSLNEKPIIVFGGGANLDGFSSGYYCYFVGSDPLGNRNCNFFAKPITDYVSNVGIPNYNELRDGRINLLILALGLTYTEQNSNFIPFFIPEYDKTVSQPKIDKYFYYDLQDAVYK